MQIDVIDTVGSEIPLADYLKNDENPQRPLILLAL
jgi:hypothetical protein